MHRMERAQRAQGGSRLRQPARAPARPIVLLRQLGCPHCNAYTRRLQLLGRR